jgi:hypothetical protein
MRETTAPCTSCVKKTNHKILHERSVSHEDKNIRYVMLECSGCRTISLGKQVRHLPNGEADTTYYPSPVSRKEPDWLLWMDFIGTKEENGLVSLIREVYQAVAGGQHRIAAMGIRALLEQVMIMNVGDLGGFDKKLDAFQAGGFISAMQRDAMRATLDVGDAAMHRGYKPSEQDLNTAVDVVEGVLAVIYAHREAAEQLAGRVPPRALRSPKS